jgi:hypothetical protein
MSQFLFRVRYKGVVPCLAWHFGSFAFSMRAVPWFPYLVINTVTDTIVGGAHEKNNNLLHRNKISEGH